MHVGYLMLLDAGSSTCSVGIAICAEACDVVVPCQWLGDGQEHVSLNLGRWDKDDERDF